MGMGGGGGQGDVKSDINVTPLVDVCLVLLIIFMVVTPMLQKGVDVMLPKGESPAKKPDNPNQVLLAMKIDKTMWYDTKWYPESDMRNALKELYQRAPGKEVILKADSRLEYGDVKKMMKLIKDCGYQNIGLIAERIQK
jgi:biopolymer transport protein TolR